MALTGQAPFNRNQFRSFGFSQQILIDQGSGSIAESVDTVTSVGAVSVAGSGAIVEPADVIASTAAVYAPPAVTSALNFLGNGPSSVFNKFRPALVSHDILAITAVSGAGAATESADSALGLGYGTTLTSSLNAMNLGPHLKAPFNVNQFAAFRFDASGQPAGGATGGSGSGAAIEGADVVSGVGGAASTSGSGAMTDASDVVTGTVSVSTSGSGAIAESHDAVAGYPASVPTAPTQLVVTPVVEGAILLFAAPASNGGSPLTAYVATASPGGAVAMIQATTTPAVGLSARIYFSNLAAGGSYTFTVHAVNAAGIGPESAPSSAVSPLAYADYYVTDGGSETGFNPLWSNYNGGGTFTPGVAAGSTLSSNLSGVAAPANPVTSADGVYEADIASPYGYMLFYKQHDNPANNGNGRFPLAPYDHLQVSVYPTVAGHDLSLGFYKSAWYNGVSTANGTDTTLIDTAQNWPVNQFASFALNDMTAGIVQTGVTANTATTVTFNTEGVQPQAGDYYELQQADISFGNSITLATSGYGPTAMTPNAWNTYTVPLAALGITNAEILKFILQDKTGRANNTFWIANLAFIRTNASTDQPSGGSVSGAGGIAESPDVVHNSDVIDFSDADVTFDNTNVFFDGSTNAGGTGSGAITEGPDTVSGQASGFINSGSGAISEAHDVVSGSGEGFVNTAPLYTDPVYVVVRTSKRTFTVTRSIH